MARNRIRPDAALVLWIALVAIIAGLPASRAAVAMLAALPEAGFDIQWMLLLKTLAWAVGIGLAATLLALPIALASRGLTARWSPLAVLPILLPMPLAYAGLNLFRAPGTALGDWLAMGPSWRAVAAGRLVAVLSLALWSTALAAPILALGLRTIDRTLPESAALAGAGRWRRLTLTLAGMRASIIASAAVVAVVMTGSAIPLHLAQINTYSITLWLELDATPAAGVGRVWLAATPVLLIAIAASAVISTAVARAAKRTDDPLAPPASSWPAIAVGLVIIAAASLAPLALLARELTTLDTFSILWRTESDAVIQSAIVAACVGIVCALVAWVARVLATDRPRAVAIGLVFLLVTSLAPGVLVGSAVAASWRWLPDVGDSPAILVLAHLARLSALAALLGILIAAAEPPSRRDARALDGATGLVGSLRASGDAALALAVGLIAAAMSLGEIEASVVVQPPGAESVARSMLNMLHFARYEHLSGLVLLVAAPALLLGGIAWILIALGRTLNRRHAFR